MFFFTKIFSQSIFIFFFLILSSCINSRDAYQIKKELKQLNKNLKSLSINGNSKNISVKDIYKEISKIKSSLKSLRQMNILKKNQADFLTNFDEQMDLMQELKGFQEEIIRQISIIKKNINRSELKIDKISKVKDQISKLNRNINLLDAKISQLQEINEISLEEETKKDEYNLNKINSRINGVENKIVDLVNIFKSKTLNKGKKLNSETKKVDIRQNTESGKTKFIASGNYQTAYNHYLNGNYDKAIPVFKNYIEANPHTRLSDNAQYWLAECYYSKKQYDIASLEFNKVLTNFPKSSKVPAALLKIAFTLEIINKPEDAYRYLNILLKDFPGSEEAMLGKNKFNEFKKKFDVE